MPMSKVPRVQLLQLARSSLHTNVVFLLFAGVFGRSPGDLSTIYLCIMRRPFTSPPPSRNPHPTSFQRASKDHGITNVSKKKEGLVHVVVSSATVLSETQRAHCCNIDGVTTRHKATKLKWGVGFYFTTE
jgi:hypothetical protein